MADHLLGFWIRPPRDDTAHAHKSIAGVPRRARDKRFRFARLLRNPWFAVPPDLHFVMTRPAATIAVAAVRQRAADREERVGARRRSARTRRGSTVENGLAEQHLPPLSTVVRCELARVIVERLEPLPEAQRKVLALHYFEHLSLPEIAAAFRVSESRICQVHAQAILAINHAVRRRSGEAS